MVLDQAQAQAWITEISEIIGMYLTEPEILEMAAQDMMDSLSGILAWNELCQKKGNWHDPNSNTINGNF